jgi:HK97 gp10 family phage protein
MPELKMKLRALQREVQFALKEASLAAAAPIHDTGEFCAPRSANPTEVGHLADHIEVEVTKSTPSACQVRIGPDHDHWYGRFSEMGTSKMAARPFLRPAIDTQQVKALKEFAAVMKRRLR